MEKGEIIIIIKKERLEELRLVFISVKMSPNIKDDKYKFLNSKRSSTFKHKNSDEFFFFQRYLKFYCILDGSK